MKRLCGCGNEARYHELKGVFWSDYPTRCGLCDIKFNDGRGKLERELDAEVNEEIAETVDPPPPRGMSIEEALRLCREWGVIIDGEKVKGLRDQHKGTWKEIEPSELEKRVKFLSEDQLRLIEEREGFRARVRLLEDELDNYKTELGWEKGIARNMTEEYQQVVKERDEAIRQRVQAIAAYEAKIERLEARQSCPVEGCLSEALSHGRCATHSPEMGFIYTLSNSGLTKFTPYTRCVRCGERAYATGEDGRRWCSEHFPERRSL